jgi:hypothetical protein
LAIEQTRCALACSISMPTDAPVTSSLFAVLQHGLHQIARPVRAGHFPGTGLAFASPVSERRLPGVLALEGTPATTTSQLRGFRRGAARAACS